MEKKQRKEKRMHLKRIELTNYRQHRRLDVDFNGNMIAVLGQNGSGKSNLIGAIQFALTGEQPGFTKSDLTTWGEKEGSVRLFFTAGSKNEEFVITRKTDGNVVLKVGDETIKQARKVEEALREKAGLDKELIRQIVFVPQKGIDSILFDDPKNREVAFQRLIGIGNASKIYEALRTEIANYDKPQGFDEAIAQARKQLAEHEGLAKVCRETLGKYESALKSLPSKETLEGEVDRCAGAQQAIAAYVRASQSLEETQKQHESALAKLAGMGAVSEAEEEGIRENLNGLEKHNETLRADLESVNGSIRILGRLKEIVDSVKKADEELSLARQKAEDVHGKYPDSTLEEANALVESLGSKQVAAESELRSLRNLVQSASSDGTCPVCGAPATQDEIESHLREKLTEAERKASDACEKAKTARMEYDKREALETNADMEVDRKNIAFDTALEALKKAHDANVEGCEINIETFEVSYKGSKPDDLQKIKDNCSRISDDMKNTSGRILELRSKLSDIASSRSSAKEARESVSKFAAQIDLITKNKKDCAERLASLGIDPTSVGSDASGSCDNALKKARANLDAYNGILRDMAGTKGQLESTEKTIESTKNYIDDLVEKKEVEDKVKEKVDVLKRVRDWFHYREGPRIMSQNVMKELTACVNKYLDQFCAPFVVEAEEEGFGFRCRFIDGRTMPDPHPDASMLSGGQKVALAIAFRMAIYMTFGGELGLLSLDEPTAYLDDASIEHLGELLQKVGEVARNKGLQILMATHEKAIMPFLDTKIDLGSIINKED